MPKQVTPNVFRSLEQIQSSSAETLLATIGSAGAAKGVYDKASGSGISPFNITIDNTAKTFDWHGETDVSKLRFTKDKGVTFLDVTAKPQPLGDDPITAGDLWIQYKPSAAAVSTTAYTPPEISAPTPPTNVILVAVEGQSQGVGRAAEDLDHEVGWTNGVYEFRNNGTLQILADPTGQGASVATTRSFLPKLGKRIKELTGHDVIFTKKAIGNTAIHQWQQGEAYAVAGLNQWNAAIAYCATNSITIYKKFYVWSQGETDAGVLNEDQYFTAFHTKVTTVKADYDVDGIFVIRTGYDPYYTSSANSEMIMEAQEAYCFLAEDVIMGSKKSSTFNAVNGLMKEDGVHYSLPGLNIVGEDTAQAIDYFIDTGDKIEWDETVTSLIGLTDNSTLMAHYSSLMI